MPLLPSLCCLWSPIGQYVDYEIGIARIICFQMHGIVMLAVHPRVHHEDAGFNLGAFTGLEYHRTDG
jgi:hypothetical protein